MRLERHVYNAVGLLSSHRFPSTSRPTAPGSQEIWSGKKTPLYKFSVLNALLAANTSPRRTRVVRRGGLRPCEPIVARLTTVPKLRQIDKGQPGLD